MKNNCENDKSTTPEDSNETAEEIVKNCAAGPARVRLGSDPNESPVEAARLIELLKSGEKHLARWIPDEAEDVAIATLFEAWKHFNPNRQVPFEAFYFRCLRHRRIDAVRKTYRRQTAMTQFAENSSDSDSDDEAVALARNLVLECAGSDRELLELKFEGLKGDAIARALRTTESAVKMRWHRFRERFSAVLREMGIRSLEDLASCSSLQTHTLKRKSQSF